jgi:hypothetical protein
VIDTAFKGSGTNFAWIIPVPSVPTVEPATTGLFSTLQIIFQPKIVQLNNMSTLYQVSLDIFSCLIFKFKISIWKVLRVNYFAGW